MKGSNERYESIRLWGGRMGSFSYYIERQVQKAIKTNAPWNAIYEIDGKRVTVDDIKNQPLGVFEKFATKKENVKGSDTMKSHQMKAVPVPEVLSDKSVVWNVELITDDDHVIVFACEDRDHALELNDQINKTLSVTQIQ